jgi:hypothetical protein
MKISKCSFRLIVIKFEEWGGGGIFLIYPVFVSFSCGTVLTKEKKVLPPANYTALHPGVLFNLGAPEDGAALDAHSVLDLHVRANCYVWSDPAI